MVGLYYDSLNTWVPEEMFIQSICDFVFLMIECWFGASFFSFTYKLLSVMQDQFRKVFKHNYWTILMTSVTTARSLERISEGPSMM